MAQSLPKGSNAQELQLFTEKERIGRLSRIRELVFGALDGILVPVGVISAVAGGTNNTHAVIVAGLAEAFAGALSMGAGEFISGRSEAQVHQSEVQKELAEIQYNADFELREMTLILQNEGLNNVDAQQITDILARYPHAYQKTMVEKELGLQLVQDTVRLPESLTMSVSYIIGSIFPLIAYFFFPIHTALPISLVLTIVALVIVGVIKGRLAKINIFSSSIEIVVVGAASAIGGYLVGTLLPHVFGF